MNNFWRIRKKVGKLEDFELVFSLVGKLHFEFREHSKIVTCSPITSGS